MCLNNHIKVHLFFYYFQNTFKKSVWTNIFIALIHPINGQLLIRSAQTGLPNARKRRPVFPPSGQPSTVHLPGGARYLLPV